MIDRIIINNKKHKIVRSLEIQILASKLVSTVTYDINYIVQIVKILNLMVPTVGYNALLTLDTAGLIQLTTMLADIAKANNTGTNAPYIITLPFREPNNKTFKPVASMTFEDRISKMFGGE